VPNKFRKNKQETAISFTIIVRLYLAVTRYRSCLQFGIEVWAGWCVNFGTHVTYARVVLHHIYWSCYYKESYTSCYFTTTTTINLAKVTETKTFILSLGSIVQKGKFSAAAWLFVSTLKNVDFLKHQTWKKHDRSITFTPSSRHASSISIT